MFLQFPVQFDSTLGAAFIGCVVAAALYGIGTSQAAVFFLNFPHESVIIKYSVVGVWVMDTLNTLLVAHVLYTLMVTHFGEPLVIIVVPWSYWVSILATTIGDSIVRLFFVCRLWKLSSRSPFVCFPSIAITLANLLNAIGLVILGLIKIPDVFMLWHYSWIIYLALSLIAVGDIWFAAWLTYYVQKSRESSRDRESVSILNTILVYTVNTGCLTAVLSVLSIIMYSNLQDTDLYMAFFLPLDKLYTNAMLATLNVRSWSHAGIDGTKVPIVTAVSGNLTIPVAFTDAPPPEMHIYVDREVVKAL